MPLLVTAAAERLTPKAAKVIGVAPILVAWAEITAAAVSDLALLVLCGRFDTGVLRHSGAVRRRSRPGGNGSLEHGSLEMSSLLIL